MTCLGATAKPVDIYSTQFEVAQGFKPELDLAGQDGWTKIGSGGNGLVTNFFAGQGQQAYIGFTPPAAGDTNLFLYRPVNFSPVAAGLPLVRFSTLLTMIDSNNDEYDFFQWSVYNQDGDRLLTVDFDVFATNVSYALDGNNPFVNTGVKFGFGTPYTLTITMNFASNRWSATLNSALLATNQPLTTTGRPLTLGDVDAVWDLYDPARPGSNYMVFDNYSITAGAFSPALPPPPRLEVLGRTGNGLTGLRLTGQSGNKFAIEATTNFTHWTALKTNLLLDGSFDYLDTTAPTLSRRLYRARWVP